MEFAEGDVGLPGGIQILEPANLYPTYEDSIHRSLAKNCFLVLFWSSGLAGRCLLHLLKSAKIWGHLLLRALLGLRRCHMKVHWQQK